MEAMTDTQQTPIDQRVAKVAKIMLAVRDRNQNDLADALGLDSGQVSRVMNGKRRWTLRELETMARYFDVDISTFFKEPADLVSGSSCINDSIDQLELFANGCLANSWL